MINTSESDALLRPEISLLLPFLTATNPALLLLSTALLPLKWASACTCFHALCKRKTTTRRITLAILGILSITYLTNTPILYWFAVLVTLATPESLDTKFLKSLMIVSGNLPLGAIPAVLILLAYLRLAGYKLRITDSWELLLSNQHWLLTKDYRLAKRVNMAGEFHAEVLEKGRARLVGDGRLVGEGKSMQEIDVKKFDKQNMDVVRVAESKGRAIVDEHLVKIVSS